MRRAVSPSGASHQGAEGPAFEVRQTLRQDLTRTSKAKGHSQVYDSSAALRFEVPGRVCGRWCRNFKSAARVPRFRSSSDIAARPDTNFESKGALASL